MNDRLLTVSMAPHLSGEFSTRRIMGDVLIALAPAFAAGVYFFGWDAARVTLLAAASCVLTEFVIQRYVFQKNTTVTDLSALVTGVLLAFNLPSGLPGWMVILGSVFAIGITKMCYGGLGNNIFNPALTGRVFLMLSFPAAMTAWPQPLSVDGVTGATPLGILKEGLKNNESIPMIMQKMPSVWDLFIGHRGGCIGEVSVLALALGFAWLIYRRIISWHIPAVILITVMLGTALLRGIDPLHHAAIFFHIMTGGLILGAVFMATDYSTSPMTIKGMVIYAVGIGVLVVAIRAWSGMPEGVSFAILILNALVPLINKFCKPYRFGEGQP